MEQSGPNVGLGEIADKAGVARRTVYRWVSSKDDLLFIHPRLWLDIFDYAVEGLDDAPLKERIRVGSVAVCAAIDADPEPVARSMNIVLAHPQLMRGYTTLNQEWIERFAAEVRKGHTDPDRFHTRVIGAAIMGVIDASLFEWILESGKVPISDFVLTGLDHLAPLLNETTG